MEEPVLKPLCDLLGGKYEARDNYERCDLPLAVFEYDDTTGYIDLTVALPDGDIVAEFLGCSPDKVTEDRVFYNCLGERARTRMVIRADGRIRVDALASMDLNVKVK